MPGGARSNTKVHAVVKGSKAKAAASPEGKPTAKRPASLDSHFKSDAQSRSSTAFKKIQDVKIPPIAAFNKLTGSDDAHILKQVDGLDMEHEHILNKYNFTDWNEARRMLNLPHEVLGKLQDRIQEYLAPSVTAAAKAAEGWITSEVDSGRPAATAAGGSGDGDGDGSDSGGPPVDATASAAMLTSPDCKLRRQMKVCSHSHDMFSS